MLTNSATTASTMINILSAGMPVAAGAACAAAGAACGFAAGRGGCALGDFFCFAIYKVCITSLLCKGTPASRISKLTIKWLPRNWRRMGRVLRHPANKMFVHLSALQYATYS